MLPIINLTNQHNYIQIKSKMVVNTSRKLNQQANRKKKLYLYQIEYTLGKSNDKRKIS